MKYLDTPCPREDCGKQTLQPPKKSGSKIYTFCDACHRKSLFIIHETVTGKTYSVVPIGRTGKGLISRTFRISQDQAEWLASLPMKQQSETVRRGIALVKAQYNAV